MPCQLPARLDRLDRINGYGASLGNCFGTCHGHRRQRQRFRLERNCRPYEVGGVAECPLGVGLSLQVCAAQGLEGVRERVAVALQNLHIRSLCGPPGKQLFDPRFKLVSHLPEAHCACKTSAAFQGVQSPHAGCRWGCVCRPTYPITQLGGEQGQQFLSFFHEDREQLCINRIDRVDTVVGVHQFVSRPCRALGFGWQVAQGFQFSQCRKFESGWQRVETRVARCGLRGLKIGLHGVHHQFADGRKFKLGNVGRMR